MDSIIFIAILIFVLAIVNVTVALNLMQSAKNKKYQKVLDRINYEKNQIESAPIVPELAKIESFLKNEKLEIMYNEWKERLNNIKTYQIPKITDMLLEAEYSLSQMDYKGTMYKIAKLEMELYKVRANSNFLFEEIKEITTSEEKNRAIITKLKANYRELLQKYKDKRNEYGELATNVDNQFENISSYFEQFENAMDNNEYTEVTKIIKAINELLKHMETILEEMPTIVLLCTNILPKKIKTSEDIYKKMQKMGYPLDYLNVEYNIEEAYKKIRDIYDRAKLLNLEDSLFELKVLLDYFDSLYGDFEHEKQARKEYEDDNFNFRKRLDKMNNLIKEIFSQIDDIKNLYDLRDDELELLKNVNTEIKNLNRDYKSLMEHTGNNTFSYTKLIKEIEILSLKLAAIEDRLDTSLDAISSMKADEVRARQQLGEITEILKDAKAKMRDYTLPVIPRSYYVELNEAQMAIKEIVKELSKKPITISTLNTRVDTARDLSLKLLYKTKELLKTAMFAEMAIVYGNKYRALHEETNKNLSYSEVLFFKGEYKKSLELTINTINRVEPGIYNKLLSLYGNK